MYEVYHWEAHPSKSNDSHKFQEVNGNWWKQQPFTKPQNVEHRIIHHEAYKKAYPDVTIPGLVDDGPDGSKPKTNTGCIVSKKYRASYTSVYVVGRDGNFAYISHWPPGPGGTEQTAKIWVDTTYKRLDKLLTNSLPTPIIPLEHFSVFPEKFIRIRRNGTVSVQLPRQIRFALNFFNMMGKSIVFETGYGSSSFTLPKITSSGVYLVRLSTTEGTYFAPISTVGK